MTIEDLAGKIIRDWKHDDLSEEILRYYLDLAYILGERAQISQHIRELDGEASTNCPLPSGREIKEDNPSNH